MSHSVCHNPTYQTPHNDGYMFQAVLRLSDSVWPWTAYITDITHRAGPRWAGRHPWRHLAPLRTGSAPTQWQWQGLSALQGSQETGWTVDTQ